MATQSPTHKHDWRVFVGIPVFGDRTAWVNADALENRGITPLGVQLTPWKWACDTCGEQGYEVPA